MPQLKDWNGLARASIKAHNGLAFANWKAWNGLSLAASDPSFASVVLLCINDNAADTTTTFVDQSAAARTLTPVGNFQYDTAQAPTGMTSSGLSDGTGDYLGAASSTDFAYGTAAFTIETFLRVETLGTQVLLDQREATADVLPAIYYLAAGSIFYFTNNANAISGANGSLVADTWQHIALCKDGSGNTRLFVAGTQVGSTYADAHNYGSSKFRMCDGFSAANSVNGHTCSWRVTKGVARYTGNFTPPTLPLPTS